MIRLETRPARWFLIPVGIGMMLCLGTVYSWSIFRFPLEAALHLAPAQSALPFSLILGISAFTMPLGGWLIDRFGIRAITLIGSGLVAAGYSLAGLAQSLGEQNAYLILVLGYSGLTGMGVGLTYGGPLAVAARWFPHRKGLAIGSMVSGFGLSPLITAPVAEYWIQTWGVLTTFRLLGMVFGVVLLFSALLLPNQAPNGVVNIATAPDIATNEAPNVAPEGETGTSRFPLTRSDRQQEDSASHSLHSLPFYGLWLCYALGAAIGTAAVSIASPVAQEWAQLDPSTATLSIAFFSLFNGLGRPFFGWLSDYYSPRQMVSMVYALAIVGSLVMLNASAGQVVAFEFAFSCFWLSLGGWLAIAPTTTLAWFSLTRYSRNYGILFTAFGIGAPAGTLGINALHDALGTYNQVFYFLLGLALLGTIVVWFSFPAGRGSAESCRI